MPEEQEGCQASRRFFQKRTMHDNVYIRLSVGAGRLPNGWMARNYECHCTHLESALKKAAWNSLTFFHGHTGHWTSVREIGLGLSNTFKYMTHQRPLNFIIYFEMTQRSSTHFFCNPALWPKSKCERLGSLNQYSLEGTGTQYSRRNSKSVRVMVQHEKFWLGFASTVLWRVWNL